MAHTIPCPEVSHRDVVRCMADPMFVEDVADKVCSPDNYDVLCESFGSGSDAIFRKAQSIGPEFYERFQDAAYDLAQQHITREWEAYPYHDEELDDDI